MSAFKWRYNRSQWHLSNGITSRGWISGTVTEDGESVVFSASKLSEAKALVENAK